MVYLILGRRGGRARLISDGKKVIFMKVLIVVDRGPIQKYLVTLCGRSIVKKMKQMVNTSRYSDAATIAFKRGVLENVAMKDEDKVLEADLILSRRTASWDLSR